MLKLQRLFRRPQQPPQPQFTDAQIAERAYVLWQARQTSSKAGTETDDWEAAKASLLVESTLPKRLRSLWSPVPTAEAQKTALELHKLQLEQWKVWILGVGVLATVLAGVGLYLTYRTGQEQQQQQLNTERLVTDRFAKAVEQLGNGTIDVRIGAIYSLERIAKDSPKDHWTIMEVLTAFVRNKSPLPKDWKADSIQVLPDVTTDVQSALTVIKRREVQHDPEGKLLDLSKTNLSYANLTHANLRGAHLSDTHLSDTHLSSADLGSANLSGANLRGANLRDASLINANLSSANLGFAVLRGANLGGAVLRGAVLSNAYFEKSSLYGADLSNAYGLTANQVKTAQDWQKAHYDPTFRQQLGLPPETPSP